MGSYGQKITASWRLAVLALAFAAGIAFLAAALHGVQVERSDALSRDQVRQSVRRVLVPGARGRIFDRNGVCLADNRASYCIVYYLEELSRRGRWVRTIDAVDKNIDELAEVLGIPRQISYASVSNHVMQHLVMPLVAWRDVEQETLARWAEAVEDFPGVDVVVQAERFYPQGPLAAHALGYVGRERPKSLTEERVHDYLLEMLGKGGIEEQYNARLSGVSGKQLIRVDARGYKSAVWEGEPAVAGRDVRLTLDVAVQRALERALQGRRGAGVAVDPRNGEVLALASAPAYDPNEFVPVIPSGLWKRLLEDPELPLFNRAVLGQYAPGSTFKPVTAVAAMMQEGFDPQAAHVCNGVFVLGAMRLRCWNTYGHGAVGLRKAIEQSCNSFFCNLGYTIGYDAIYAEAEKLGLGKRTGIDLPAEAPGLLPTAEWKLESQRDKWRPGDTCHISIGQGLLLTSPLQMAMLASVFANGGTLYRPRLLLREGPPERVRDMAWRPEAVGLVRDGMHDVAVTGTGRRVRVPGVEVAAKTGTAEIGRGATRRKNTWVTAFAPFEQPTVAVAVMVENGESGGLTVAPMVHDVLAAFFGEAAATEHGAAGGVPDAEVGGD
ncbi:MAG: penicillin-binding protein 2 [Verrucomicrobiota bacterium]|jgi:penicillin-binding protein 2|nr:penicillin-binding protein 2 [Verrucomicrobiota bacterium]